MTFNIETMTAFNKGYSSGAKDQRESDIKHLVKILESLEDIYSIGEKRAWKIREYFLEQFGSVE